MGRPRTELDTEILYDLAAMGLNQKQQAGELGISIPTLSRRIADIQGKQGILLKYRVLQSLQLTELQARVLEEITPEKIAGASLKDLVIAYKILKDKELVVEGKPTEIKGLVAYLVALEKEELALKDTEVLEGELEEIEGPREITDRDYVPEL